MKKLGIMILACICCAMTACGSKDSANGVTERPVFDSTSQVIDKIYEQKQVDLPVETVTIDLSDELAVASYLGLDADEAGKLEEASASESMMGAHAYSLVVAEAKEEADVPEIAQKVADGIDQRKWICVEADDLSVVTSGKYVMMFMVGSDLSDVVTADEMTKAFETVCQKIDGTYTK